MMMHEQHGDQLLGRPGFQPVRLPPGAMAIRSHVHRGLLPVVPCPRRISDASHVAA